MQFLFRVDGTKVTCRIKSSTLALGRLPLAAQLGRHKRPYAQSPNRLIGPVLGTSSLKMVESRLAAGKQVADNAWTWAQVFVVVVDPREDIIHEYNALIFIQMSYGHH